MSQNSTVILTDSQESKINISIVGSCVSRDVFGFTVNQQSVGYSVERFVQSVNPVSAVSGLVGAGLVEELVNESEKSEASNFYKRCFKLDVQKNWIDYLSEKKSDWLIIDMSTVSSPVISVDDTYISYNLFCAIRKKFKTLEDESAFAKIGSMSTMDLKNMDEDYLRGVYRRFFDMLMELYPENKIIILDVLYVHTFINSDTSFLQSTNYLSNAEYSKKNDLISFAYDCAKEFMPNAHFVNSLPILIGKINHIWGMHGLHYIDAIYQYFYECIDYIICNKNCEGAKESESEFVTKKQVEYAKKLFFIYQEAAMKCILRTRNLLVWNSGVIPGEYIKNGVTLHVSSEYEYSIRGTATEETCFYLYSFTKNPLGGWRSVVNTIEEGKYMFTTKVASSLESIYIQLVLSNSGKDIKWIGGNLSTRFELTKAYTHQLIRVIINKGVSVDVEGCMILERL